MRITVSLENIGGELDSETFSVDRGRGEEEAISRRAKSIIDAWVLTPGDIIKIREV